MYAYVEGMATSAFAQPVKGAQGVEQLLPIGTLSAFVPKCLDEMLETLQKDIEKGEHFCSMS